MNMVDNWENIKYFIALAKQGQLQKAAVVLNSNHSTVYRRIRQFEQAYNLQLFDRTPSGYHLTAQGEALLNNINGIDERMNAVFHSLQGLESTLKGDICITTTPSYAQTVMPQLISEFKELYPELLIDLRVSHQMYNLSKREADIAIRPSSDVPVHLLGRCVGQLNFAVYASPNYKARITKVTSVDQLKRHKFIALSDALAHLDSKKWLDKHVDETNIACRVDSLTTLAEFCMQGVGLAVLPKYYAGVYSDLKLVYQPEEFIGSEIWVLTHKSLSHTPKIKVCTEFMYHRLKKLFQAYLE